MDRHDTYLDYVSLSTGHSVTREALLTSSALLTYMSHAKLFELRDPEMLPTVIWKLSGRNLNPTWAPSHTFPLDMLSVSPHRVDRSRILAKHLLSSRKDTILPVDIHSYFPSCRTLHLFLCAYTLDSDNALLSFYNQSDRSLYTRSVPVNFPVFILHG